MPISDQLERILALIAAARDRAGRTDIVRLIGISKTHPEEAVREAFAAGLADFGENRIQEALPKIAAAGVAATWHLVGHLQSNKAAKAATVFDWVHSIDSFGTAERLARAAADAGREIKVLIEVNTSGEAAKHGVRPEDARALAEALAPLAGHGIVPAGLMTVGPLGADDAANRRAFALLRSLRDDIAGSFPEYRELSMGMSGDFESAILEGATMVRVGSAIFGAREYGATENQSMRPA